MAMKATALVGLDEHARQTHAAVLDVGGGELRTSRLRMAPVEVVSFLDGLGPGIVAVYEAGPTGFGLARAGRQRGIDVRVAAPGSIPKSSGDRVKTDRRDAIRLVRLLAAGELRFAFVPSVADEQFRDLIRAIEDCRGDLMRARHRLSKFLLRRELRWLGPGSTWTKRHMDWLRARRFEQPTRVSGFLGVVPCEHTSDQRRRQGSITKAGPPHARRLLVEAAHHYRYPPRIGETLARRQAGQDARVLEIAWRCQRRLHQRWQHLQGQRRKPAGVVAIACAR